MKKFFFEGFVTGVLFIVIMAVPYLKHGILSEEMRPYYEDELSRIEGYNELSSEQARRIESLKENLRIGEMVIFSRDFNEEWYETHDDVLLNQEISFKNINEIYFGDECYQVKKISSNSVDYYHGLNYYNAGIYFGKKKVVDICFQSLEDSWNGFFLRLAGNGNIFFCPGELVNYGDGDYTCWGMYEVLSDVD